MSYLYLFLAFLAGGSFSVVVYALLISRDKDLVHLQADEVIIKRPLPEFILVQVTPDVARRLISTGGEMEVPNKSEARALYPERSLGERQRQMEMNQ